MKFCIAPFFTLIFNIGFSTAQNSTLWVSAGWATSEIEDVQKQGNGITLDMLYDKQIKDGGFSLGFSFGYRTVTASDSAYFGEDFLYVDNKVNAVPICFKTKYTLGDGNFTGYVKGIAGIHYSNLKRTAKGLDNYDNTFGLTVGGGAGFSLSLNQKYFMFSEYEILWLSNSFFSNSLSNTVTLGIGYRF